MGVNFPAPSGWRVLEENKKRALYHQEGNPIGVLVTHIYEDEYLLDFGSLVVHGSTAYEWRSVGGLVTSFTFEVKGGQLALRNSTGAGTFAQYKDLFRTVGQWGEAIEADPPPRA